jgi:transposase
MTNPEATISFLQTENLTLKNQVKYLEEQLAWLKRQVFGQKSEKVISTSNAQQLLLEGFENLEKPPVEKQKVDAHSRKKPSRNNQDKIAVPSDLPVETEVIDLPENEKVCKETGEPLVKIGEEVTCKLACKPGSYYVKRIVRPKYALPKNSSEEGIKIASLPEGLFNRCQADESLLADVAVKKFADHIPLYRQCEILNREDINISRQILSQWMTRVAVALKPLYEEMSRRVIQSENIFIDEVPIDMLDPGKGKTHQAYMWVLVGGKDPDPPYRIYNFRTDRKHSNANDLLKGYTGILHSDKYGAYETLANKQDFVWCPCWAHIRRKFFESGESVFRDTVLKMINELFSLEQDAWKLTPDERLLFRVEHEVPVIDQLTEAIKKRLIHGGILPKSKFKEALGYYCSLIPYLKNYTAHSFARLDNNVAERAIRPLVLGRKNWLFVGSETGGETAAILMTLIQSARAVGINPRAYLEDIMRRLMSHNTRKLQELLPDAWAKAKGIIIRK